MSKTGNVGIILEKRLCSGCGACAVSCSKKCISIRKGAEYNFPYIDEALCSNCGMCLKICPGKRMLDRLTKRELSGLRDQKVIKAYTCYANDAQVRFNSASGGIISSLALMLLNTTLVDGVICAKQNDADPLKNKAFVAVTAEEILQASGSRYSPVSNCEALNEIIKDGKMYAFIGKPCEIDALSELQKFIPGMKDKIKYKISIMCASTPSAKGTLKVLEKLNIKPGDAIKISYRGKGWPGCFTAETRSGESVEIPYLEAWNNYLSKYSCLRCTLCDDPFGKYSDITAGDAWDKKLLDNAGTSLCKQESSGVSAVLVRTSAGKKLMDMAVKSNIITAKEVSPDEIYSYQRSLVNKLGKAEQNIFAYNLVFGKKLCLKEAAGRSGISPKVCAALLKRAAGFYKYKRHSQYY